MKGRTLQGSAKLDHPVGVMAEAVDQVMAVTHLQL